MEAATPEIAVVKAMNPLDHAVDNKARYKWIFPVPQSPLIKKAPDLFKNIQLKITSNAIFFFV